ncbi:MAG: hypothetical protein NTW10_03505 [Bacteroidetes bacterium]|nr:hypothetical protein [Bacteroidota bacterium]
MKKPGIKSGLDYVDALSLTEAIIESVHNGILVVSSKGKVLRTNRKFTELWNIPDDILESADDKLLLKYVFNQLSDPKEFMAKVKYLYAHPEDSAFDLVYFKDGRAFERISRPLYLQNKPNGRIWSFFDITDRVEKENAFRKKAEELEELNKYFVNRELKMIELKKEINELLKSAGREEKHIIH